MLFSSLALCSYRFMIIKSHPEEYISVESSVKAARSSPQDSRVTQPCHSPGQDTNRHSSQGVPSTERILTKVLNSQVQPTRARPAPGFQYNADPVDLSGFWPCQPPDPRARWYSSSGLRQGLCAA